MILAKDVPIVNLRKAVFAAIQKQSMQIYGVVPAKAEFPYITIGAVLASPADTKLDVFWNMSVDVDIWATEQQQQSVYEAINDITTIFSLIGQSLDLGESYVVTDCSIKQVETFPEQTTGFHGLMTLAFLVERKS